MANEIRVGGPIVHVFLFNHGKILRPLRRHHVEAHVIPRPLKGTSWDRDLVRVSGRELPPGDLHNHGGKPIAHCCAGWVVVTVLRNYLDQPRKFKEGKVWRCVCRQEGVVVDTPIESDTCSEREGGEEVDEDRITLANGERPRSATANLTRDPASSGVVRQGIRGATPPSLYTTWFPLQCMRFSRCSERPKHKRRTMWGWWTSRG
ncbi:hypothetical protein JB92DRAFT_2892320, partial [Gautieria morchelliformis]